MKTPYFQILRTKNKNNFNFIFIIIIKHFFFCFGEQKPFFKNECQTCPKLL